jgi:hypothetical protein
LFHAFLGCSAPPRDCELEVVRLRSFNFFDSSKLQMKELLGSREDGFGLIIAGASITL